MAGSMSGGRKAAETNRAKYGEDFYRRIGSKGGNTGDPRTKGFASRTVGKDGLTGLERARAAGSIGGKTSRRPKQAKVSIG